MVADTRQVAAITSRSAGNGRNGGEWAERVKTLYNVGSGCYNRLGSARAATGQEKPMISRFRWGICGLVAITLSLAWVVPATASSDVKTVNYRGYQLDVPRSWPVYDLARTPSSCIRFDRHAVYLGAATAAQTCPAHLVGQTEALWIAPLGVVPAGASILRPGRATPTTMPVSAGHRSSFVVRSAGVLVNASYGANRGAIGAILASGRLTAGAVPAARIAAAPPVTPQVSGPGTYAGSGFDACAAPSAATMQAWGASPYRAIGVYIGGINRACAQANLTSSWVSAQDAAGWHMFPIYVGLQAPCSGIGSTIDPGTANSQGQSAAQDAANQATSLGLDQGSVLYEDMEAYGRGGSCSQAVLDFLNGWTTKLHALGYGSGVYSSTSAAITDLVGTVGTGYPEPDHIYFAHWGTAANTTDPAIPAADWTQHQRIHQYAGGHNETYGGVQINIDNDVLDVAPYVPAS